MCVTCGNPIIKANWREPEETARFPHCHLECIRRSCDLNADGGQPPENQHPERIKGRRGLIALSSPNATFWRNKPNTENKTFSRTSFWWNVFSIKLQGRNTMEYFYSLSSFRWISTPRTLAIPVFNLPHQTCRVFVTPTPWQFLDTSLLAAWYWLGVPAWTRKQLGSRFSLFCRWPASIYQPEGHREIEVVNSADLLTEFPVILIFLCF